MVDSRQKGARAETAAKKELIKYTKLKWERVPGSGALNEKHMLKGDLYIPGEKNRFCVEVKHYKDDHLTSKVLTDKDPQLLKWWKQAVRQGNQVNKEPILLFKFDRSKWFIAFDKESLTDCKVINGNHIFLFREENPPCVIMTLKDFMESERVTWIL